MSGFSDTSGDDNIKGTDGDDTFSMSGGGDDVVKGMGGHDEFYFGENCFTAADQIDGGTGGDFVRIQGDYSAGLVFGATTMVNVEGLEVDQNPTGRAVKLVFNEATVAAGNELFISAYAWGSYDASADTDGSYSFAQETGPCTFNGGAGDDRIAVITAWSSKNHYDGGAGDDVLSMGVYEQTIKFAGANLQNIETVRLAEGDNLTVSDANVAAGRTLTVQFNNLDSDHSFFNGAAEKDGAFDIEGSFGRETLTGGHGADTIVGGDGDDVLTGGVGADQITGGAGADTFAFSALNHSSKRAMDHILDLQTNDLIDLSQIDANSTKAGDQAFHLVAKFTGGAGEAMLRFKAGETLLSLDVNGDGKADAIIAIDGDHHDFTNFVL